MKNAPSLFDVQKAMTKDEYYSRRGCEKQIVLFIILIILFLCCKKTTNCYECYTRKYIVTTDTIIDTYYGVPIVICDMTQDEIDIFESMNNNRTSTGGTDIQCRIK